MKISVIVPSRFWSMEMSSYFQHHGVLNELVVSYPKFMVKKFGIDPRFVKSLLLSEVINRTVYALFKTNTLHFFAGEIFDWTASKTIKFDSDVYFIWSGFALRTIKALRKKNKHAKIILVRGSSHIAVQARLLKIAFPNKDIVKKASIAKETLEYEAADYITVPSTFAYNSFIDENVPAEKLFINYLGVNLKEFPYQEKKVNSSKELIVGNVGHLSSRKNVAAIIRVIEKLNNNGKKIKLILVGSIDKASFDEKLLEKDFIQYKGTLPQNKLHLEYAQMDLFIINSIEEGLAMVQMQAMSTGLPLISTKNAGGLDLVKDAENGFTIPILDDDALEEKISWFYENKNRIPAMGKISWDICSNGFTWEDFGERNLQFIKTITGA